MGNVDVVRGMYEAFGRGDIEAVLASFDPQIEWRQAESNPYEPEGKPWIGPDAIVENLFMKLGQEWDSFTVSPREFYDAGEAVIVEGPLQREPTRPPARASTPSSVTCSSCARATSRAFSSTWTRRACRT